MPERDDGLHSITMLFTREEYELLVAQTAGDDIPLAIQCTQIVMDKALGRGVDEPDPSSVPGLRKLIRMDQRGRALHGA